MPTVLSSYLNHFRRSLFTVALDVSHGAYPFATAWVFRAKSNVCQQYQLATEA